MVDVNKAFELFGELVQKRFGRVLNSKASIADVSRESEDTIRYMMFYALMNTLNIQPEFVFLEYPHPYVPAKKNPKLDTFIEAYNGVPSMAFEMKFTVKNEETGNNLPKAQVFGALISDMIRLHHVPDVEERFFVWVFDRNMGVYFCNKGEPWRRLLTGESFELTSEDLRELPKVALDKVRENIGEKVSIDCIGVSTAYAKDFVIGGRPFGIRVYRVDGEMIGFPLETDPCKAFKEKKRAYSKKVSREKTCIGSKYSVLAMWLGGRERRPFEISLDELEKEVATMSPGFSLPPAARKYLAWWANHKGNVQAGCGWLSAGWKAKPIFKDGKIVGVEFTPL